ncbi:unnamed protein product [Polarella glacialis]|uniref:Citrate synthase n=1 Tax=Polarella glacialis TaxID=89957 RepID=A0A813H0E0_POLGL|nr:unnamed protein product [Polarella glacialis]
MATAAASDNSEVATLTFADGRAHQIKIVKPTFGDDVFLDIRDLHAKTGCFTFDPGFTSTGACMSAITFIDGPKAESGVFSHCKQNKELQKFIQKVMFQTTQNRKITNPVRASACTGATQSRNSWKALAHWRLPTCSWLVSCPTPSSYLIAVSVIVDLFIY